MNKKSFTLIELLTIIVVLSIILIIAVPIIMNAIEESRKEAFRITGENLIKGARDKAVRNSKNESTDMTYTITDGEFVGNSISTTGELPDTGTILVQEDGSSAIAIHNGKYCASKTIEQTRVTISQVSWENCYLIIFPIISYNGFDSIKGVNGPAITPGLTPVYWNGSSWVNTTKDDDNWYNYTIEDKKWANAISDDGSLWVWIPRFSYQLSENFHINDSDGGTINIKFLKGNSNDTPDATIIGTTPTYSGSSQTNYVVHPAFTFGSKEITGFWIAKFEATMGKTPNNPGTSCDNQLDNVTTENIKIVPNISAWRCISVSNAFLNSFSMQTKQSIYGWDDSKVDTHLIKNSEWAAASYFAQSPYGKGTEDVWMNPQSGYITGCGGTQASQSNTSTCTSYNIETRTGTTSNIYSVYDMSGGSSEFIAAHMDNLVIDGETYINGQALVEADIKYREVYTLGVTDTAFDNYAQTQYRFGDALWETSSSGSADNRGWYMDSSMMPFDSTPWLIRGSHNRSHNGAGLYAFYRSDGLSSADFGFRPVLLVGEGL